MMIIIHIQNKWEETFFILDEEARILNPRERKKGWRKKKSHRCPIMHEQPWTCHPIGNALTRRCERHDGRAFLRPRGDRTCRLNTTPPTHTQWHVFFKCWLFIFLIISCTSKKTKLILIHIDYYSKIKGKKSKKYDRLKIIVLENWK